jgi:hypothetical protein
METPPSSSHPPDSPKTRLLRWATLLVTSILLHLLVFNWADGRIRVPSFGHGSESVVTAELRTVPAPLLQPVAVVAEKRAAPTRKPKPRTRHPAPQPQEPPAPAPAVLAQGTESAPDGIEAPGTTVETATQVTADEVTADEVTADEVAASDAAVATAAHKAAEPVEQLARYRVDPPPSVELKYDVTALQKGQNFHGSGKIAWESHGSIYTVTGEASVIFFSVLNFKSEGMIDEFGVAPVIYSEKRFRKPQTNTHFHRDRNTISFSASTAAYPRRGGEQDRASIIWQLASIGRGDNNAFAPNAEIDLFVAGVRDGETWRVRVIGQEPLETPAGTVNAWHVVRMPRSGSYDQKLDIWFAPEQEWYPVKLRYTEVNGDFLDMSLSNAQLVTAR